MDSNKSIKNELATPVCELITPTNEIPTTEGKPRIIAITSALSATGKTSLADFLARRLSKQGKRVLLIDLDYQGNLSERFLGRNRTPAKDDPIIPRLGAASTETLDDVIRKTDCNNVWMAPSAPGFINLAVEDGAVLRRAIEGMERSFDCIIIDCWPRLDELAGNAIRAIEAGSEGSFVLVPVRMQTVFEPRKATLLMGGTTLFIEEVVSEFETAPACPYAVVGVQDPRKGPVAIACPDGTPENVMLDMIDFLGIPESALREAGAGLLESSSPAR